MRMLRITTATVRLTWLGLGILETREMMNIHELVYSLVVFEAIATGQYSLPVCMVNPTPDGTIQKLPSTKGMEIKTNLRGESFHVLPEVFDLQVVLKEMLNHQKRCVAGVVRNVPLVGRQRGRLSKTRDAVLERHLDGLNKKSDTVGSGIDAHTLNQKVGRKRDDEKNLLETLPKRSVQTARIRDYMVDRWNKIAREVDTADGTVKDSTGVKTE